MDEWKDVPGYEGLYSVSRDGRLWSYRRRRLMKPEVLSKTGHLRVALVPKEGPSRKELVHRIVLRTFAGPCPEGLIVRHLDGNPRNNRVENLRYGTQSENTLDSVRHGTHNTAGKSKTHCPKGHPYDEENTYISPRNPKDRRCRICARTRNRNAYRSRVGIDLDAEVKTRNRLR